jgi:hypothetical protein
MPTRGSVSLVRAFVYSIWAILECKRRWQHCEPCPAFLRCCQRFSVDRSRFERVQAVQGHHAGRNTKVGMAVGGDGGGIEEEMKSPSVCSELSQVFSLNRLCPAKTHFLSMSHPMNLRPRFREAKPTEGYGSIRANDRASSKVKYNVFVSFSGPRSRTTVLRSTETFARLFCTSHLQSVGCLSKQWLLGRLGQARLWMFLASL